MIFTSEHRPLLGYNGILARNSEQVHIEDWVLFGRLDELVGDGIRIICMESLQSILKHGTFIHFLLVKVLNIMNLFLQFLFLLLEVALNSDGVLVSLVLNQKIALYLFIKVSNFLLLVIHLFILAVVDLEQFLKLKLKEGMLVHIWLFNGVSAISVVNFHLTFIKLGQDTPSNFSVIWSFRLRILARKGMAVGIRILSGNVILMNVGGLFPTDSLL